MKHPFFYKSIYGIRVYEYLAVLGFYFVCAVLYHTTLWINSLSYYEGSHFERWFNGLGFMQNAGVDYLIKLLVTIPIWWLIFRKLEGVSLKYRLPLHLLGLPAFLVAFKYGYYGISEMLGWWRLEGGAQIWDIYIPGLFYCIQFGIFHAYEHYRNNQRNLKLQAKISEAALKSELSALKAQLNPHFLYNVFNTISASVPPQLEETREMIAKLSDLFRYQLKASKSELVPLEEELEFIENYLDLEKARFEDRLKVFIEVPDALRRELVPPMILQPLVENSIKHGIAPLIEGGEVTIFAAKKEGNIHFRIQDTGVGVKDKSKLFDTGIGLTNTRLRLEKQYGSQMQISNNIPHGLIIEFTIQSQLPAEEASEAAVINPAQVEVTV